VVELWYDHEPALNRAGLLAEVRRSHADAEPTSGNVTSPFQIAFPSLVHQFSDGATCLVVSVSGPDVRNDAGPLHDLTQTWSWPEAAPTLARTTYTLMVADPMGRLHAPGPRAAAFRAVVNAIIAQTRPIGTWWPASTLALPPQAATTPPLGGLVNVRLFNNAGRPGHLLMDTVGMHALGLPDAQIYFHDLSEGRVAALLFDLAKYVFSGANIHPGHTVQGVHADQRWRVSYQPAKVDPERLVLELDPGPASAASQ
jgi:hypothetical protein